MTGFSIDWLNLREEADRRARDPGLLQQASRWLTPPPAGQAESVVVDLGAGTGSTLRALCSKAGPVPAALKWRLVDHDPALLAEAQRRHGDTHRVEICPGDLAQPGSLPLEDARLVTASALFDLVSAAFIDKLIVALQSQNQEQRLGVYAALNYDGSTAWTPPHPLDDAVLTAFNQDQQRDKGFGPALGPNASSYLEFSLKNAGFQVSTASSPWVLDAEDASLTSALIEGIASAVASDPQLNKTALEDWRRFRLENVPQGTCTVGHTDVLALADAAGAD
ncbi:MAG: class I SAM-dependent methyltransferase [Gammaproteobacteria bacterium]